MNLDDHQAHLLQKERLCQFTAALSLSNDMSISVMLNDGGNTV